MDVKCIPMEQLGLIRAHPIEQEVAEDHTWMWLRCSLCSQSFPQQHHHTLGVTWNERWEKLTGSQCSLLGEGQGLRNVK